MAVTQDYHVNSTGGATDNSGSSETVKVSGTAAVTDGTTLVQLDVPSALSTVVVGDSIRIAARVDGIRSTNIYEITAVNDGLDQVSVTPSPAAAVAQTWTIGGAFTTIQRSVNVVRAGEKTWIKATANYNEQVTVAAGAVGTVTAPVVFEGYTTTKGDDGVITIDGQATRVNCWIPTSANQFHVFKHMRFTGGTGSGFAGGAATAHCTFKKCRFDTNALTGCTVDANCIFEGCYAHNNTTRGFLTTAFTPFLGCIAANNGTSGFETQGGVFFDCIGYSNAVKNFISTQTAFHLFINCTVDGDAKDSDDGFDVASAFNNSVCAVLNCIAYDCTTGFRAPAGVGERWLSRNNLVNANTTAYVNFSTFEGEVTAAPGFVNEATADHGITGSSAAKNAGFGIQTYNWVTLTGDNPDIGAMDETAGGAGLVGSKAMLSGGRMM
jgi:hypothetical protein